MNLDRILLIQCLLFPFTKKEILSFLSSYAPTSPPFLCQLSRGGNPLPYTGTFSHKLPSLFRNYNRFSFSPQYYTSEIEPIFVTKKEGHVFKVLGFQMEPFIAFVTYLSKKLDLTALHGTLHLHFSNTEFLIWK